MRRELLLALALFVSIKAFSQCSFMQANFTLNPSVGCSVPHTVFFTDQSSFPDTWFWSFGDGGTSTAQNPIHSYTTEGEFTVRLIISDTVVGCLDTAYSMVSVSIPTADFSGTALFGCGPMTVDFTDLSSGNIANWLWDFGDGHISEEQTPSYTYQTPGVYSIELTITDVNGCQRTKFRPDYIQVIGPDVNFGPHALTTTDKTIEFTDSTNFGAPIVAWSWDFGDGLSSSLQNPTHTYDAGGNYSVSLTVSDIDGCSREKIQEQIIIVDTTMVPIAVKSTICEGTETAIKFPHSIEGLDYYLSNAEGVVDGPLAGNGDTLVFSTGTVLTSTSYVVHLEGQNNFTYEFSTSVLINIETPSSFSFHEVACDAYFFNGALRTNSGVYFDTLLNAFGCDSILELDLEISPKMVLEHETENITCHGRLDGSVTVFATGGIVAGNYSYQWNDPLTQTTATASDLAPGNYEVVVSDDYNCNATITVTIEEPEPIELSASSENVSCADGQNGHASVTASGGTTTGDYQYFWNDPSGQSTATAQNLSAGTYIVIVRDNNNCAAEISVEIQAPDPLVLATTVEAETAVDAHDGSATVNVNGGTAIYTYQWNDPQAQTTATATNLAPGNYAVTVTDANGCSKIIEVTIEPYSCAGFDLAINATMVPCHGDSGGTISIDPIGGNAPFEVVWSTGQDNSSIGNLSAGVYTTTITDDKGCRLVEEIVIEEPSTIALNIVATDETAVDAEDGTANVNASGGVGDFTYQWNDPQAQTTATATNLAPGNYTVTVTDANGCHKIIETTINPHSCLGFELSEQAIMVHCHGGTDGEIIIDPIGGNAPYEVFWSSGQSDLSITNLSAGQYIATITDDKGCVLVQEVTIEEPEKIELTGTATHETAVGANDGTASISASGGIGNFSYLWNDPQAQSTATATGLAPGTYTVSVSDANDCTETFTFIVDPYQCGGFEVQVNTEWVSCHGGTDGFIGIDTPDTNGPYSFEWSNGQDGANADNLSAGLYSITVTDGFGCTSAENIEINQPNPLEVNLHGVNGKCSNLGSVSANVTGGTAPYTYHWNNDETEAALWNLEAGMYTVIVTDAHGCKQENAVEITIDPGGIDAVAEVENVSCFGEADGAITLDISGQGPFTFEWNNGATTQDLQELSPGNYSVYVTDREGCNYLLTYVIYSPAALGVEFDVKAPSTATSNDGQAVALVSGGVAPYSYNWSNGNQNIINQNLGTGSYQVTITDANGCQLMAEVQIVLSTAVRELENLDRFEIFPNPAKGLTDIVATFSEMEHIELLVYDVLGRQVYQKTVFHREIELQLDLSIFDTGFYLVQIRTEKGQIAKKLLVVE